MNAALNKEFMTQGDFVTQDSPPLCSCNSVLQDFSHHYMNAGQKISPDHLNVL